MTSGQSRIGANRYRAFQALPADPRRRRLPPRLAVPLFALLALLAGWYFVATVYLIFRDDLLARLIARQAEMQYAYEDRVSALRAQIDRITSRQLVDQDSMEGRVHELLSRQAQLETRNAMVMALAEYTGQAPRENAAATETGAPKETSSIARTPPGGALKSPPALAASKAPSVATEPLTAYAPIESKSWLAPDMAPLRGSTGGAEPVPLTREPRRSSWLEDGAKGLQSLPTTIRAVTSRLNGIEAVQVAALRAMDRRARTRSMQLQSVVADLGLDVARVQAAKAPPQGGPFVPVPMDALAGPFESLMDRLQKALVEMDRMNRLLAVLPLRKPLPGDPDITSGFGYRVDPFNRSAAMHTGIDFRDDYGAAVRSTAAGRVVTAESSGGYGNLVEIDHGAGISTRYAHLSAITVDVGQTVGAGAVVGRLGSTGRSTGPHLHYETRIDGEAVDPVKYLRAGTKLAKLQ